MFKYVVGETSIQAIRLNTFTDKRPFGQVY